MGSEVVVQILGKLS